MEKTIRVNVASLMLSAGMTAVAEASPRLGQQTMMRPTVNQPGERLKPKTRNPRKVLSQADVDRMDAAEAKRLRRFERDLRNQARGSRRQTATPRAT